MKQRFILAHAEARRRAREAVASAPDGYVVTVGEAARKLDQNAAMWSGPLFDIAEQAWVARRRYPAETWHEYFKRKYLPEIDDADIDALVIEGYRKWDIDPSGERVLIGSTTQLTVRGMAQYMMQIEAYGSNLGVRFRVPQRVV